MPSKLLILLILLFSCSSEDNYEKIFIGETIKIYHEDYINTSENFIFKWTPPKEIKGLEFEYVLKEDIFLFTPASEGRYEISLNITDISDEEIENKKFYYEAIIDTNTSINLSNNEKNKVELKEKIQKDKIIIQKETKENITKNSTKKSLNQSSKTEKNELKYAIQIEGWPGLAEARMNQLTLLDLGFDSYIEKYINKNGEEYNRVRIGNFNNKSKALIKKKEIENILNANTWLAIVKGK